MDAEKRRAEIARFIVEHDGAGIGLLAERFAVSAMTIRRDRKILAGQNRIAPTHGGAVPAGLLYGELPYPQKATINLDRKRAIARAAAELIEDHSCVVLDAGTTTLELARLLMHRPLTVVTVDLHIALLLAASPSVRVVTPGGEVDPEIQAQIASSAVDFLQSVNAAIAFIGGAVWDAGKGLTCSSIAKQKIKRTMLRRAARSVLLVDAGKYGLCNPWDVAPLGAFGAIVTDDGLPEQARGEVLATGAGLTVTGAAAN
jgi:DeoR family transcriptional regulator, fructose operon transcriptional repressor